MSDKPSKQLTHINEQGDARMVDVGSKPDTKREAVAEGLILMQPETLQLILDDKLPKGDVLAVARVAGIMGAKKTSELIPMCHPLLITHSELNLTPVPDISDPLGRSAIKVEARVGVQGKTGIEMEALTAVSTACLTLYDMCKAIDRGMEITHIRLMRKEGGKSGLWIREED